MDLKISSAYLKRSFFYSIGTTKGLDRCCQHPHRGRSPPGVTPLESNHGECTQPASRKELVSMLVSTGDVPCR